MNNQIKFLLFTCMIICISILTNCNSSTENKGTDAAAETESIDETHSDENGDLSVLNVRVVRKTRGDDVIETGDCAGTSSCYSISGTDNDQIVEVQFCTNNTSTTTEAGNFVFVINQADTVSLSIPSVPVGKSSMPYTTNTTNVSGAITSLSVNINDEGASSISPCNN